MCLQQTLVPLSPNRKVSRVSTQNKVQFDLRGSFADNVELQADGVKVNLAAGSMANAGHEEADMFRVISGRGRHRESV